MRQCPACKKVKEEEGFLVLKNGLHGKLCIPCREYRRIRNKEFNKARPEVNRKSFLKFRYGMDSEDVEELLKMQEGKCNICNRSFNDNPYKIDHCHSTGKVRGLLCHQCNTGLGMLNDDIEVLRRAITYLQGHLLPIVG